MNAYEGFWRSASANLLKSRQLCRQVQICVKAGSVRCKSLAMAIHCSLALQESFLAKYMEVHQN
jgi:hypothetical protein